MSENKEILLNYLISINNKTSEDLNNTKNQKEIKNKDINEIDNINSNGQISFDLKNKSFNIEKNNGSDNILNLNMPISNEINNESKTTISKELSNFDTNKNVINIKNTLEQKNNNIKDNDNDYNKCFKNRMDIMQAVLDDELNISSEENNFLRRRTKSRTTIKKNNFKEKEKNKKEYNILSAKEKEKNENKEYMLDKEKEIKEIKEEQYFNKANGNEDIKQINKEENNIKKNFDFNIDSNKNIFDYKYKEKDFIIEENKNIKETSKIKEEKNNKFIIQNNLNKISEEINFEIFNEKPHKERKGSYIDINFNKSENKNKNKYNSERTKNKDNSEFNHIFMEKKNSEKINKTKVHFNKSYINIKDYKNNNLVKRYSELPISQKYYNNSNNKNNVIKINNYNNINNKIFQEPLDCLINKIKNNNNFKGIKNINNK